MALVVNLQLRPLCEKSDPAWGHDCVFEHGKGCAFTNDCCLFDSAVELFGSWDAWTHPIVMTPHYAEGADELTAWWACVKLSPGTYECKLKIGEGWYLAESVANARTTASLPVTADGCNNVIVASDAVTNRVICIDALRNEFEDRVEAAVRWRLQHRKCACDAIEEEYVNWHLVRERTWVIVQRLGFWMGHDVGVENWYAIIHALEKVMWLGGAQHSEYMPCSVDDGVCEKLVTWLHEAARGPASV